VSIKATKATGCLLHSFSPLLCTCLRHENIELWEFQSPMQQDILQDDPIHVMWHICCSWLVPPRTLLLHRISWQLQEKVCKVFLFGALNINHFSCPCSKRPKLTHGGCQNMHTSGFVTNCICEEAGLYHLTVNWKHLHTIEI